MADILTLLKKAERDAMSEASDRRRLVGQTEFVPSSWELIGDVAQSIAGSIPALQKERRVNFTDQANNLARMAGNIVDEKGFSAYSDRITSLLNKVKDDPKMLDVAMGLENTLNQKKNQIGTYTNAMSGLNDFYNTDIVSMDSADEFGGVLKNLMKIEEGEGENKKPKYETEMMALMDQKIKAQNIKDALMEGKGAGFRYNKGSKTDKELMADLDRHIGRLNIGIQSVVDDGHLSPQELEMIALGDVGIYEETKARNLDRIKKTYNTYAKQIGRAQTNKDIINRKLLKPNDKEATILSEALLKEAGLELGTDEEQNLNTLAALLESYDATITNNKTLMTQLDDGHKAWAGTSVLVDAKELADYADENKPKPLPKDIDKDQDGIPDSIDADSAFPPGPVEDIKSIKYNPSGYSKPKNFNEAIESKKIAESELKNVKDNYASTKNKLFQSRNYASRNLKRFVTTGPFREKFILNKGGLPGATEPKRFQTGFGLSPFELPSWDQAQFRDDFQYSNEEFKMIENYFNKTLLPKIIKNAGSDEAAQAKEDFLNFKESWKSHKNLDKFESKVNKIGKDVDSFILNN
tara:strand:+ start:2781 stop:4520 length:1740 start_codon:yes stop_codon:yes gene_type:complete